MTHAPWGTRTGHEPRAPRTHTLIDCDDTLTWVVDTERE